MGGIGSSLTGVTSGIVGVGIHVPTDTPLTYLKQSVSYYLNLFTSQYKTSPKLVAFQNTIMKPIDDLTAALIIMNSKFDLDFAQGACLDLIGEVLGQGRTVGFQPSGGLQPKLVDDDYKVLLRATLARNLWDGALASIYPILQYVLPGALVLINDNQNMTCDILVRGVTSSLQKDLITNGYIIPRPEGVLYNYIVGTSVWFGFDRNDATIAGFDTGHFA